jgi:hypothetical protein
MRTAIAISVLLSAGCVDTLRAAPPNVDATFGAVDRAVSEFVASLTPDELQEFQKVRRKEDLALFHFGAGSRFRAKYFATPPVSPVRRAYCGVDAYAYCDIDAASMDMVVRAWQIIRAESQR